MSHWIKRRIDIETDRRTHKSLRSFSDISYYICASRFSAHLVRMKIYRSVCLYVCMNVYMYVCIYVCMYVRIYICIYVWMYVHT
jgi:hypothetical protein